MLRPSDDPIEALWQDYRRGLLTADEMRRLQDEAMPLRCACGGAVIDAATGRCARCWQEARHEAA